ncbi:YjbQ family protein [Desulfoprunum benzoelyticum]|nr:secondary thiamine-phosphate synthase enzyme YjbQ [Desulfoprunum benzoelyticum]MBM9529414.1 YjbQ family protein [Desulfoprunum benzoelyticum]
MQSGRLSVSSRRHMELIDITDEIKSLLKPGAIGMGLLYLFNPHTTAGLTVNEGADPAVREDIIAGLSAFIPASLPFKHAEGNSPAHIMASLIGSSLTLFVENGRLVLGQWQRVFFCEFDGPRNRHILWRFAANLS